MAELDSLDLSRKVTLIYEKISQINFVQYFIHVFVFFKKKFDDVN